MDVSDTGLLIGLFITCCCLPCILVLGLFSMGAIFLLVMAVIFMCFPLILVVLTVLSGGTAAPLTIGLLCVWAGAFCCCVYACYKTVSNIGADDSDSDGDETKPKKKRRGGKRRKNKNKNKNK